MSCVYIGFEKVCFERGQSYVLFIEYLVLVFIIFFFEGMVFFVGEIYLGYFLFIGGFVQNLWFMFWLLYIELGIGVCFKISQLEGWLVVYEVVWMEILFREG